MIWLVLGAMVPSMFVCWAAGGLLRRLGPRIGLLDRPGHRKVHATPMPTGGGLAIWLGIVVPLGLGQLATVDSLAAQSVRRRLRPRPPRRRGSPPCRRWSRRTCRA